MLSSHSPNFVTHNSGDIPSIIRLNRRSDRTLAGQISSKQLRVVFQENQQINEILAGTSYEAELDDLKEEMEAVKYFLWLNAERCGMFFSQQVLLVPVELLLE